jgi:hypothetical protein
MSGLGRFIRLFGVKPLQRADAWKLARALPT